MQQKKKDSSNDVRASNMHQFVKNMVLVHLLMIWSFSLKDHLL